MWATVNQKQLFTFLVQVPKILLRQSSFNPGFRHELRMRKLKVILVFRRFLVRFVLRFVWISTVDTACTSVTSAEAIASTPLKRRLPWLPWRRFGASSPSRDQKNKSSFYFPENVLKLWKHLNLHLKVTNRFSKEVIWMLKWCSFDFRLAELHELRGRWWR